MGAWDFEVAEKPMAVKARLLPVPVLTYAGYVLRTWRPLLLTSVVIAHKFSFNLRVSGTLRANDRQSQGSP